MNETTLDFLKGVLARAKSVTLAPVYRSRSGSKDYVWLVPIVREDGIETQDITHLIAPLIGERFDNQSGGIKAASAWVCLGQAQRVSEITGVKIKAQIV